MTTRPNHGPNNTMLSQQIGCSCLHHQTSCTRSVKIRHSYISLSKNRHMSYYAISEWAYVRLLQLNIISDDVVLCLITQAPFFNITSIVFEATILHEPHQMTGTKLLCACDSGTREYKDRRFRLTAGGHFGYIAPLSFWLRSSRRRI